MAVASVGKILLLLEIARQVERGILDAEQPIGKRAAAPVADSGLWQHLSMEQLSIRDAATLVGAVSDNLATNVLIQRVGLEAVQDLAESLGLRDTGLHDLVRDTRGVGFPPTLATGTAAELGMLVRGIRSGQTVSSSVSARARGWMALNIDLSMVATAFDLDPLAHVTDSPSLFNKTGTDAGVRVDVGSVRWEYGGADYAVLANWDEHIASNLTTVMRWMRSVGEWIRHEVCPAN